MKIKIINPKHEYKDNGDLIFTATCQLFTDDNAAKFLFERPITSTKNISTENWYEELKSDLISQRNNIAIIYQQMIFPITSLFPCCNTPNEIASKIAQIIEETPLSE